MLQHNGIEEGDDLGVLQEDVGRLVLRPAVADVVKDHQQWAVDAGGLQFVGVVEGF
jgi:hypothetical protein